jgi:isocitrate lyase
MGGKRLTTAGEMCARLTMIRRTGNELGAPDLGVIARTDAVSATTAPDGQPGRRLAIERLLRYADTGVPDLLWCEFPTSDIGPFQEVVDQVRRRFPAARFAFNYSSSLPWHTLPKPPSFDELAGVGAAFIFVSLAAQHAAGAGVYDLFRALREHGADGFARFQAAEASDDRLPTRDHHAFTGLAYYDALADVLEGDGASDAMQPSV